MKLVIFGATGRTGQVLVREALGRGHTVTAVARRPAAITLTHEHLQIVQGMFDQPATIEAAIRGQDAVLSAVGAPQSRAATTVHADSARGILAAMNATGVRRFICITSGGTNPQPDPDLAFVFAQVFRRIYMNIYRDQMDMEQLVMASNTDWTIVRPAALTDKPPTGRCREAVAFAIRGGTQTPRADLARFMLDQIDRTMYVRKGVALAI